MPEWVKHILETLLPFLLTQVKEIVDNLIPGEKLSHDQVKTVKTALSLAEIWGPDYVASTANTMDDEGLQNFIAICKDTLEEAGA
jgi:hypothetical protein